jgi:NADH-quinone oxidoreductase subunit H
VAEVVAACALVALLVLGAGAAALRAVLDGRRVGVPPSVSVVAPLAESARLLRSRPAGRAVPRTPVVAGVALLAAAALRVLALPIAGGTLGLLWLVAADVVWWAGAALLAERGDRVRTLLRAAVIEAPLLVALAAPVVAAGSLRAPDLLAAQQSLPFAAEAPVALLVVLLVGGLLLPAAVPERGTGAGRLLVAAARAVQPVSAAAVAAVLLLGLGGSPSGAALLVGATALLAALVVWVAHRLPVLRPQRLVELSAAVLLPLALVQLGVVVVLTLLGGRA